MQHNNSKHTRNVFFSTLLLFVMLMTGASSASAATERKPQLQLVSTKYTSSGTEVTLRLWMFNSKGNTAHYGGYVWLDIDDTPSFILNGLWKDISNVKSESDMLKNPQNVALGSSRYIVHDGIDVGTAQFGNLRQGMTYKGLKPYEPTWYCVDLKLAFNNKFPLYGHKIAVRGLWYDNCEKNKGYENISVAQTINGYVRPTDIRVKPSGNNLEFSWKQEGYNTDASTDGKWIVYKREDGKRVKVGEVEDANKHSLRIKKKQFSCKADYNVTFLPNAFSTTDTICGLTSKIAAAGHKEDGAVCQMCRHSFFRYKTSNNSKWNINRYDFGAKVVSHNIVNDKYVIEFDAPITKIPNNVFSISTLVGELRIPKSVTSIGASAFYGCSGLTGDLTLPNSIKTIGTQAFSHCTGFNGTLTLPNSLTTIGENAFDGCSKLTGNLTLPNSITSIGAAAFMNCSGFKGTLTLPNTITSIENGVFFRCSGLTGDLTLSNSIKSIKYLAFSGCTGFNGTLTLPSSITTIGNSAFSGCSGFTGTLILPNSLTTIEKKAFYGCSGFTGNLTLPKSLKTVEESTFEKCSGFNGTLTLPNSITTIGTKAFSKCAGFTGDLTLPNSLTSIGIWAFMDCSGFNGTLTLPQGKTILEQGVFSGCSGFTGPLTLPNTLVTIERCAFEECSGFTGTLTLPNSLTTIGESAFMKCSRFTGTLTLPNSLETIGEHAFSTCTGLEDLKLSSSMSVIPKWAFEKCSGLFGEVVIPSTIKRIEMGAFQECENLNKNSKTPSEVTLPESLEAMGDHAFGGNYIKTLKFKSLPEGVFNYVYDVTTRTVSLTDASFVSDKPCFAMNIDTISYTRTMSDKWGTLVLPFAIVPTGKEPYRIYTIESINESELVLSSIRGKVAAGTPCVVQRIGKQKELCFKADRARLNVTPGAIDIADMTLNGTFWTKELDEGFIIAKDRFWSVADLKNSSSTVKGVKVGPFRAWLSGTSASGTTQLAMRIKDTTGIDASAIDVLNAADTEYYDLNGKRIESLQRGVNIVRLKSGQTKKIIIR
ncbi:leucine-rich repeat domain-containing protein [Prevotella sp.]|uniref:leucine-rich repeat domain-containing protein n=1 Tax=Prevotella sp. TaxID=59823 RepID=UPI00307A3277